MTDFTSTLTCITNNTSGCSAVQAVPVFDKVFNIIARMTTECSGLTKVLKDDQVTGEWNRSFYYTKREW